MQEGVIIEDSICMTISNKEHKVNMVANDYTQVNLILGISSIDDWYDVATIDDLKPHISAKDKKSSNFDDYANQMFNSKG